MFEEIKYFFIGMNIATKMSISASQTLPMYRSIYFKAAYEGTKKIARQVDRAPKRNS
jgi:hypothetical protein